jgi:predicted DNA-binding transcriptional regulator YafY
MNRTDRLLAIVLELQGKRSQRAEDLARTFETSKRTIYRDMLALGQAGVPLMAVPGRGYALMEGYFLPPLSFSADEAAMLLLGSEVMAQRFDAQYRGAAESAGRKIAAVLPERRADEVRALRESIFVGGAGAALRPEVEVALRQLRRAILEHVRVRFRYHTRYPAAAAERGGFARAEDGGGAEGGAEARAPQTREADPYALAYLSGAWYLSAYCHLRRAIRHFRLERMESLEVLAQTFARPAVIPPVPRDLAEPGSFTVRVRFDAAVARWVREAPSFYTTAQEECENGGLLVTLRVRRADEVVSWLLGWGQHVRVLEPDSVRQRIAAEARALLRQHGDG